MGRTIARRIVGRHLRTMARLGIGYDLLTHESDVLHLHFFTTAFEQLQASGAVRLEADGKNAGCWVMPLSETAEFAGLEDPDKVIVRSDGTVTYVGKDIASALEAGSCRDFAYRYWMKTASGRPRPRAPRTIRVSAARGGGQRHRRAPELLAEDRARQPGGARPHRGRRPRSLPTRWWHCHQPRRGPGLPAEDADDGARDVGGEGIVRPTTCSIG
jgi:hypothetical protein